MKATTLVSIVAGALFIGAIAFAENDTKQTYATKPAMVHKVSKANEHQAKSHATAVSNKKQDKKPVMKQTKHQRTTKSATVVKAVSQKTVARHGIHHVKHQAKKTDAQKQMQKKS